MNDVNKPDYIQLVTEITGNTYTETRRLMTITKKNFGITYKEYYKNEFYKKTLTQQAIEARKIISKKERRNSNFEKAEKATGLTRKEIVEQIRSINEKNITHMNIALYAKFEVYRFEDTELENFLQLLEKRNQLKRSLRSHLKQIDTNQMTYSDISDDLHTFYDIISKLMSPGLKERLSAALSKSRPDLNSDKEKCDKILVDMEVSRTLLSFSISEYVSFHFWDKSLPEKREFITNKERGEVLKAINDNTKFDILDNKFSAYSLLKKYYKRKIILIEASKDYGKFKRFCRKSDTIVIKPVYDSFGRGIKPVVLTGISDLKSLFKSLLDEYNAFIVEELIHAHDTIRILNPDSVNTVRLVTYYNGSKTIIHKPFMKIGQKGSFVDNGGSGGIVASIDPASGILNSDGCDENGVIYKTHPYTNIPFKGYQLPDWQQAIKLGQKLSNKIPGLCYIGWDITYTEKGKWIVVEGNAKTQFIGQQCTTGIGARRDFMETVGYTKPSEK